MKKLSLILAFFLQFKTALFAAPDVQEIVVKEGDTIWGIAQNYLQDPARWPDILKQNNLPLTDPNAALPGMKIKVPVMLIKEHLRKADLIYVLNEVFFRRKIQPVWKKAVQDLDLYNDDGLRTMEDGEAHIKFFSGDVLKVARSSLVILRPELKREEANLLTGMVRAGRTKIITPTVEVNPRTPNTLYKARVRADKSTVVQVEKGSTEVLGIDTGKRVILEEGHANVTLPKTAPSAPVKVPPMPGYEMADFNERGELVLPSKSSPSRLERRPDRTEVPKQLAPPSIPKPKVKERKSNTYRVQLSLAPTFARIILDQEKPLTEDLDVATERGYKVPDGRYYRRVSYTDASGNESEFYALPPVEIDTKAPLLTVIAPKEGYRTRNTLVNIDGEVDLGAIVTVNGHPVEVKSDGKFRWPLILNASGENKIRIVAKDLHDNQTVVERIVTLVGGGGE